MGLNYGLSFTSQTLVTIPAATHGLGHAALRGQVYDAGTPRQRVTPGLFRVDPTTFAVTLQFLQPQSGLVVLGGALAPPGVQGNQAFPFTVAAGGTATVLGTQHGFGTDHLLIDVYDNATPRLWLPYVPVTVDPTTFTITATFAQAQAGTIVVSAAADLGSPNQSYPVTLAAGGTLTVLGTTHGLATANLGPHLYDALGQTVVPSQLTVHPSTYTLTLSVVQALTGTLVLNGSVPSAPTGPRMVAARAGSLLLGGLSQGQATTALEQTTGYYTFTFVDEAQQGVPAAVIETLDLTLYDAATAAIINGRMHQNVLNANQGTLASSSTTPLVTTFTLELLPVDTQILDQTHATEQRVMLFRWTWAGGQRSGAHTVTFPVTNVTFVP